MDKIAAHFRLLGVAILFFLSLYSHAQFNPTLLGNATAQGNECFQITPNLTGQSGAIWSPTGIDMANNFIIEFRIFLGTNDANGADGITFVLKNNTTPLIGNLGGGMGYAGIGNSIAVEFDTWQNIDLTDPFFDHIAIVSQGNNDHATTRNLAGPVAASAISNNIEDGLEHSVRIEWNATSQTLSVFFDCDLRLSYTEDLVTRFFAGNTFNYFGFTSSTGGSANLQRVCFDYISFDNVLDVEDTAICAGGTVLNVDATINGATSYSWLPATGVSNPAIANPAFSPTVTTTYTVDITNSCGDVIQESFTVNVGAIPVSNPVADVDGCGTISTTGMIAYDLSQQDANVLGTQDPSLFTISYYSSQADADAAINPFTNYMNTATCQRIYARIESSVISDCFNTTDFELCLNVNPIAHPVAIYRLCDDPSNNNSEVFDLPSRNPELLLTQNPADFTIEYFTSQANADLGSVGGATPVNDLYSSGGQTMYVRIENNNNTACFDTTTFDIIVDDIPVASAPQTFIECDDPSNDGVANITLSQFNAAVLNGQTQTAFIVSYHNTQQDAVNDTNLLPAVYQVSLGSTTIYARIDNLDNQTCASVSSFDIILNEQAVANPVTEFRLCDDLANPGLEDFDLTTKDVEVLGIQNPADFTIEYFTSQVDADLGSAGGANPLNNIFSGSNGQTIFVRIETVVNTSCFDTTSFNLFVDELPVAGTQANITVCDDASNDGVEDVNLAQFDVAILAGQTNPNFIVTYHNSQTDADNDINALLSPYTVSSATPNLFVRIDNNNCFTTTNFQFIISPTPTANPVTEFRLCDDISVDGLEDFDLTTKDIEVLGTQNPADFTIEYFTSQVDADLGSAGGATPLMLPFNSGNTTVFARIEALGNTNCFDTVFFNLFVDELPVAGTPVNITVCDDSSNDGVEDVNLAQFDMAILAGQTNPNFIVTYHSSQTDADNDTNALLSPYTVSSATPNLFARIDNNNCFTTTSFQFIISPTPTANPVQNMITCDDTGNDGTEIFDLSTANAQVLGNQNPTNFNITYHLSQSDANDNLAALPAIYASSTSTPQTIFVRIESTTNLSCIDTTSFTLTVSEQPIAGVALDQRGCDDASNDGIEAFDFSNLDTDILDGLSPTNFTVTYHNSQADADNGANVLSLPYTNVTLSQTIYARVANNSNAACYDTSSFGIEVFERPVIASQGPISICSGVDQVLNAGAGFTSYLWSTGETTQSITVNQGGDYEITVFNTNGCDSSSIITVIESDIAVIQRIDVRQFKVNTNHLTAIVTGSSDYEYSLDDFIYQDSPRFNNLVPGYYTIYVRDKNGCGTISMEVVIIGAPPFFTPNQDGFHDTWQVIAIDNEPNAMVYIFDRFGKLLKQLDPQGRGWDGTYNGTPMPSSDYWYMVELSDGRSFKGHFALKR